MDYWRARMWGRQRGGMADDASLVRSWTTAGSGRGGASSVSGEDIEGADERFVVITERREIARESFLLSSAPLNEAEMSKNKSTEPCFREVSFRIKTGRVPARPLGRGGSGTVDESRENIRERIGTRKNHEPAGARCA